VNHQIPRPLRGSLIERAAAHKAFDIPPVLAGPEPVARPAVVPDIVDAPEAEPAPRLRRGEAIETVAADPATETVPAIDPAAERVVPRTGAEGRRFAAIDRALLAEAGMIEPGGAITPLAEEFRMAKRQLLLTARAVAGDDADRARMILVCSAQPDEGKTFCAINLALSMAAEKDVEILLVDADFAKPDVLRRLGIAEGPGLLDALDGQIDVERCIIETDVPQLSVLPAGGRSNSDTELLASDGARALLDSLAAANPRRIVILDSPPALAASPASVLALHVGQVMLVVRADRTSEAELREAVAALGGCEHIQLLLNAVSFRPSGRRFGSYYSYYEEAGR
jgi:protein-tyrosine kinase